MNQDKKMNRKNLTKGKHLQIISIYKDWMFISNNFTSKGIFIACIGPIRLVDHHIYSSIAQFGFLQYA